jgi:hypothetical protein
LRGSDGSFGRGWQSLPSVNPCQVMSCGWQRHGLCHSMEISRLDTLESFRSQKDSSRQAYQARNVAHASGEFGFSSSDVARRSSVEDYLSARLEPMAHDFLSNTSHHVPSFPDITMWWLIGECAWHPSSTNGSVTDRVALRPGKAASQHECAPMGYSNRRQCRTHL